MFRFTNLLITAFAPGFFCILSYLLIYSGISDLLSIRASSGLLLIYLGAWLVLVVRTTPTNSGEPIGLKVDVGICNRQHCAATLQYSLSYDQPLWFLSIGALLAVAAGGDNIHDFGACVYKE